MTIGIYGILNTVNDKLYIGSSVDIQLRWQAHKNKLNKNQHDNEHLQRAWNKYGEDSFQFFVIEQTERINLIEREQHWIDTLKSQNAKLYNIVTTVSQPMLGRTHSQHTRKLMSEKATGSSNSQYGKPHSEQHKHRISESNKGRVFSEETKVKIRESNKRTHANPAMSEFKYLSQAKTYTMISPDGEEVTFLGLGRFAREHGLSEQNLSKVIRGQRNHHKGWKRKQ